MNLGGLPDWLAAIGTVGALFVSLSLLREDRRLRAVAQSARISVWAEWRRAIEGHDTSERRYFAYINNASDAPIYVDLMQVSAEPDDAPRLLVEMGTVRRDYGYQLPESVPENQLMT